MRAERFAVNPIIRPDLHPLIGNNINGPSLIRVPSWIRNPLGRYYLYFAHHSGDSIRLACADRLEGPWTLHEPGALRLDASLFTGHIASPDVHVDDAARAIRMYYHGCLTEEEQRRLSGAAEIPPCWGNQWTRVAIARDGLHFTPRPELLGGSYFRAWAMDGFTYALVMPGIFVRSRDGLGGFEVGPTRFTPHMRHSAVWLRNRTLHVVYSNAFDEPEHLLHATVDVTGDWWDWTVSPPVSILRPERDYEGAGEPLTPSRRGIARGPVHQLRDPAIHEEDGRVYLLYTVAGEQGIAIALLSDD